MQRSRRLWVAITVLALGCGGKIADGLDDEGGLGLDGGSSADAPIERGDSGRDLDAPIIVADACCFDVRSIPPDTGKADAGGADTGPIEDAGAPYDVYVPPPYDVYVPPPPYDVYVPPPDDGGFPFDGFDFDVGFPEDGGVPVTCGFEICSPSQECCVTFAGGSLGESCVRAGDCDAGVALACTGSDNCSGGDVCCGTLGGGAGGATCQPMCGPGSIELCGGGSACPPGETCLTTPFGISICRP